jgi:sRNA-binding carbon storage regulator CsrA
MLCIQRSVDEHVMIGGLIKVMIIEVTSRSNVRIAIEAPGLTVDRPDMQRRIPIPGTDGRIIVATPSTQNGLEQLARRFGVSESSALSIALDLALQGQSIAG